MALLQQQLEASHSDEEELRRKLEEINSTRSYIGEQLNQLTRDYDERVRQLEGKVDRLTKLNDKLIKENLGYREEQQLWESRFMEKERLLIGLLGQQQEGVPMLRPSANVQRSSSIPNVVVTRKSDSSQQALQRSFDHHIERE